MKWIHVKALFEAEDVVLGEDLVSDMFLSLGLQGIVCQVPLDEPAEGFGSDAVPIPDGTWVSGYLPDTDSSEETLKRIRKRAEAIQNDPLLGIRISIETEMVDQEDWAESWKNFFHVTRISERIVVKPEWRAFDPGPDDVVIEIDPGMAFGTGTHPTTSMCMALIEKYLKSGDNFLDVGTGSGILMIAAAKLGAVFLEGIDTDEVAVRVAGENLKKNGIDQTQFYLEQNTLAPYLDTHVERFGSRMRMGGKGSGSGGGFDLVAANILAEVLVDIMPDLKRSLNPEGTVILSGIILEREPLVTEALTAEGLSITEIKTEGEWVAIAATPNI